MYLREAPPWWGQSRWKSSYRYSAAWPEKIRPSDRLQPSIEDMESWLQPAWFAWFWGRQGKCLLYEDGRCARVVHLSHSHHSQLELLMLEIISTVTPLDVARARPGPCNRLGHVRTTNRNGAQRQWRRLSLCSTQRVTLCSPTMVASATTAVVNKIHTRDTHWQYRITTWNWKKNRQHSMSTRRLSSRHARSLHRPRLSYYSAAFFLSVSRFGEQASETVKFASTFQKLTTNLKELADWRTFKHYKGLWLAKLLVP